MWLVVIVIAIVAVWCGSCRRHWPRDRLSDSVLIYLPDGANLPLYLTFAVAMALLSFFCHLQPPRRLLRGEENWLDFGKIGQISRKYMHLPRRKHKNNRSEEYRHAQ